MIISTIKILYLKDYNKEIYEDVNEIFSKGMGIDIGYNKAITLLSIDESNENLYLNFSIDNEYKYNIELTKESMETEEVFKIGANIIASRNSDKSIRINNPLIKMKLILRFKIENCNTREQLLLIGGFR